MWSTFQATSSRAVSLTYLEIDYKGQMLQKITVVINEFSEYARVLVSGKPIQPSLMFLSKAGAYTSEAPFRCRPYPQTLDLAGNACTMAFLDINM